MILHSYGFENRKSEIQLPQVLICLGCKYSRTLKEATEPIRGGTISSPFPHNFWNEVKALLSSRDWEMRKILISYPSLGEDEKSPGTWSPIVFRWLVAVFLMGHACYSLCQFALLVRAQQLLPLTSARFECLVSWPAVPCPPGVYEPFSPTVRQREPGAWWDQVRACFTGAGH